MVRMYENLIAERLSRLRIHKGVSARDMSLSIGQSAGYINSIENKAMLPSMSGLFYICEYLGVTPREFFDDETQNPRLISEIVNELTLLDDAQLQNILELLKNRGKNG